jgi:hypothetical protein
VTAAAPTIAPTAATPPVKKTAKELKEEKKIYTGPTEIIVLEPTPMLDDEGRQRLDPDGKPMFNPPQKQMRDKKGHPVFENGKPVFQTAKDMGYDEKGQKIHGTKEKPPKLTPVSISRGTLTLDGMVGRASLNYEIADLKYIYIYAPGIGTAVVSNSPFPGATQQKDAFVDKTLTVNIGEHKIEVDSDKRLLGKVPEPAYVLIDRDFTLPVGAPVMGYGDTRKAPYVWPGSKENKAITGVVEPPPTPKNLLPALALAPCPKGQMRMPGPPVLPGQYNPPQPCVTMAQAEANAAAIAAATARRNAAAAAAAKAALANPAPATPALVVAPATAPAATEPAPAATTPAATVPATTTPAATAPAATSAPQ